MRCKPFVITCLIAGLSLPAHAKRSKVIDFEDDVVEGVNKRPLDSASSLLELRKNRDSHLYRKRASFKTEYQSTLRDLKLTSADASTGGTVK